MNKDHLIDCYLKSLLGDAFSVAVISNEQRDLIFNELSRREEHLSPHRDQWGNWEWSFNKNFMSGSNYRPWLDYEILKTNDPADNKWPNGKKFALCITHDCDDIGNYRSLRQEFRRAFRRNRQGLPLHAKKIIFAPYYFLLSPLRTYLFSRKKNRSAPRLDYKVWVDAAKKRGFNSTFFFFPEKLVKSHTYDCSYIFSDRCYYDGKDLTVREMIKAISESGCEIGLHGSYNSALSLEALISEKKQVESVVGKKIKSVRQHFLHYVSGKTANLQAEAGFEIDSTMGFNRNVGFRSGTSHPHLCWDNDSMNAIPILEIPQNIMDGALFENNSLELNEEMSFHVVKQLMNHVQLTSGCLTINFHPQTLNRDPKYFSLFLKILDEAKEKNAWGCSCEELYQWIAMRV